MVVFPNCKINLGLSILRKRSDGFHDLETVFYPVLLQDALEIIQHEDASRPVEFNYSGISLDISSEQNLCVKAYELLKQDFPTLPGVKMHLHKQIPAGAGLGGGSADAAFALLLLNNKFQIGLAEDHLINYALQLGSDCPFFIKNKPCLATGRGERLDEISLDLSPYKVLIVNPGIHINTGWAFSKITPDDNRPSLKEAIRQPIPEWKDIVSNDFETVVFQAYPEVQQIKDQLYRSEAVFAAMSGSGSSVFGLFNKEKDLSPLSFPAHYFVKEIRL